MKKILLILIIMLCSSCYDYKEINDLAFVNAIGIDYDTKYHLYFELLNANSTKSDETYIVSADGNSLTDAFNNISLKINKIPYYAHLKTIILDKNNVLMNMEEISDYIIRNPEIRNEFYVVITTKNSAKEIIELKKNNDINIGSSISNLIENNNYSFNNSYNKYFSDMVSRMNNNNLEMLATEISILDSDINVDGIATFNNFKYDKLLSKEDSTLLNILLNNKSNMLIEDDDLIIKIYENKLKYKIYKNKIIINVNSNAEIKENKNNSNLLNKNNYLKYNKKFSKQYTTKICDFVKNNYQFLNLQDMYYKKYKKNFTNIDVIINAKININKKGMIFNINE